MVRSVYNFTVCNSYRIITKDGIGIHLTIGAMWFHFCAALSALILAICLVTSQGKAFRKSNTNTNINTNVNSNFNRELLSSQLNSMLRQEKKGKDCCRWRGQHIPDIIAQQEGQQAADDSMEDGSFF